MSRKRLEISPKHGANPTIPVCFWCGKEKNMIALMGRMRSKKKTKTAYGTYHDVVEDNDMQAPRNLVLDYEPCKECAEQFALGVRLIEATVFNDDGRFPISKDNEGHEVYPTGRFFVVRAEAARNMFNLSDDMLSEGKSLCLDEKLFKQVEQLITAATNNLE